MATVSLPTPLRPFADKQKEVQVVGTTIRELIEQLTTTYPALKRHLLADDGSIRSFVNVYVNDEDIRHLQKTDTAVSEKDYISIIPSIAGGSTP